MSFGQRSRSDGIDQVAVRQGATRAAMTMITRRKAIKAVSALAATCPLGDFRAAMAQGGADAWLYSTPQGPGSLRRDRSGRWIETTPAGTQFFFTETKAGPSYVELQDASRRMWLRVYSSQ
jgi:hypothetical protein